MDDIFCIGNKEAIFEILDMLKKHFLVKLLGSCKEYVGCKLITFENNNWLHQPDLLMKLQMIFGKEIKGKREYVTPLPTGQILSREEINAESTLPKKELKKYRSGVGMLLYLVKLTRPDLCNPVKELSKMMDKATLGHYKAMLRVIKYVLDTKDYGLKYTPTEGEWNMVAYSDSDFAGDKTSRKSVSGFLIFVKGVLVSWKSKGQKIVALSSTEAEYVAFSEAVREVLFIQQLMVFMGVEVKLPTVVHVDNVGAIYLAQNSSTGRGVKHMNIKHHFVREYIEKGVVMIKFVESENNTSDICTKNVGGELLKQHTRCFLEKIPKEALDGEN